MSNPWPTVRVGDVLRRATDAAMIDPEAEYSEITVKLWGKGVVRRRTAPGATLAGSRRFVAQEGQLIVSRIDARNGALGIVPLELSGAVVTNDFPVFELDRSRIEGGFLKWLTRTRGFVELCQQASEGTTNRVRLNEQRFLGLEIPLPPLTEQRRIVAKVEGLSVKIAEAQVLMQDTAEEWDTLLRAMLASSATELTPMQDLVRLREPDVLVRADESYQFAGVYSFGRGVFRAQLRSGFDFSYDRLTRLRAGDLVYPKLMAWEGALGVVPDDCDGCVVSPEFPVFELDRERVLPETLDVYFRAPHVWRELSGASTGTNVRRRRLHPQQFLAYKFPLPPIPAQARLRALYSQMTRASRLRNRIVAELDGLLPSILARAFRGEL